MYYSVHRFPRRGDNGITWDECIFFVYVRENSVQRIQGRGERKNERKNRDFAVVSSLEVGSALTKNDQHGKPRSIRWILFKSRQRLIFHTTGIQHTHITHKQTHTHTRTHTQTHILLNFGEQKLEQEHTQHRFYYREVFQAEFLDGFVLIGGINTHVTWQII